MKYGNLYAGAVLVVCALVLGGCHTGSGTLAQEARSRESISLLKVCPKWLSPDNPTDSGACMFDATKVELTVLDKDMILAPAFTPMIIICGPEVDPDRVVEKVAASTLFQRQKSMIFTDCGLGDAGAAALARSGNLHVLENLTLDGGAGRLPLGDAGAAALARATGLGRLERLVINGSHISDQGAGALADATGLDDLEFVSLSRLDITAEAARRFIHRNGLPQLDDVSLEPLGPLSTEPAVVGDLATQALGKGFVLRLSDMSSGVE